MMKRRIYLATMMMLVSLALGPLFLSGCNQKSSIDNQMRTTQQSQATTSAAEEQALETSATAAVEKCADPAKATPADFTTATDAVSKLSNGEFKTKITATLATYADNYAKYVAASTTATPEQKAQAEAAATTTKNTATQAATAAKSASNPNSSAKSGSGSSGGSANTPKPGNAGSSGGSSGSGSNQTGGSSGGASGGSSAPADPHAGQHYVPPVYDKVIDVPAQPAVAEQSHTVTYWKTSDGQIFDTNEACVAHMKALALAGTPVSSGTFQKVIIDVPAKPAVAEVSHTVLRSGTGVWVPN